MEIKNILVTGSCGYIGSVLTPLLLAKGYNVVGIDALFFKTALITKDNTYRLLHKDVRHIEKKDLEGIDAIIHLAALSNDAMGEIKKELTQDINHKATIRLAKMAKQLGVKRFIFSSSCSIYGIAKSGVANEKTIPHPLTKYAKAKIQSEKALNKLADKNFTVVSLRNATVYGFSPCFRDDLVVNNLTASGLTLNEIQIKSDGTPWRPLIDVRDLSEIFIHFLQLPASNINKKIINVGFNENNFQVKDIVSQISTLLPKCSVVYTNEFAGDKRSYRVNFNLLNKILPGYRQQWPLEKSIKDLIKNLGKYKYTKKYFQSVKYTRLKTLKSLMEKQKLNQDLYWK